MAALKTQRAAFACLSIMIAERRSRIPLVMGFLFLLVGLIFTIGIWGTYFEDFEIERSGPRVEGHLARKEFVRSDNGDSDYVLQYSFTTAEGQLIKAQRGVGKSLWASLREGQALEIRYSAANPKRNFPAGAGITSLWAPIVFSVLGTLFCLLGGALIWGFFHPGKSAEAPEGVGSD